MSRRRSGARCRSFVALVLGVVALAACTSGDPAATVDDHLAAAVQSTFEGSFAYRLEATADRDALEDLGERLGPLVSRLNLFEVEGVIDGDVVTVDVRLYGVASLLEFRRFGDDELYARVGLEEEPITALVESDVATALRELALDRSLPAAVGDAIEALFAGKWIGVTGTFDAEAMDELVGRGEVPSDAAPSERRLLDLVSGLIEVETAASEAEEATYRITLRLRELLDTMARVGAEVVTDDELEELLAPFPTTVEGVVRVVDGNLVEVVFDVAAAARAAGEDVDGSLVLRLELSQHGAPAMPARPEDSTLVDSTDLLEAVGRLVGLT